MSMIGCQMCGRLDSDDEAKDGRIKYLEDESKKFGQGCIKSMTIIETLEARIKKLEEALREVLDTLCDSCADCSEASRNRAILDNEYEGQ
jgi:hypothetical protein